MAIGISPLVDYAFKRVLGDPEHSGITMHFLNAVLAGQPKITQVTFLNPILDKQTEDDKLAVLDILATDEHGRRLNIEMQTSLPTGMAQRLAYYTSAGYVYQLSEGQGYSTLRPSISICVLAKALFHNPRWERLTFEDVARLLPDRVFREAFGVLQMISQTAEEMIAYQARLKHHRDEEGRMMQARLDGEARGIEIGELRGQIGMLQKLLGQVAWTTEQFSDCDLAQLKAMAEHLERQLKARIP